MSTLKSKALSGALILGSAMVLLLTYFDFASAVSTLDKRAVKKAVVPEYKLNKNGRCSYVTAAHAFEEAYSNVVFCKEFLPLREDNTEERHLIDFRVLRNQKLSDALDTYCGKLDNRIAWEVVTENVIAFYPNFAAAVTDLPPPPLDTKIALRLDNATVNEAINALEQTVNQSHTRGITVATHCEAYELRHPPSSYYEGSISLDSKDRKARQILWEIIRQAPVPITYTNAQASNESPDNILFIPRDPKTFHWVCGDPIEDYE